MKVIVIAQMDMDPAHARTIIEEARPLIEDSLAEPGCLAYSWALNPLVPGRVEVFELWTDSAALAHHFTLPAYTEMKKHIRSRGQIKSTSRKYLISDEAPIYDPNGQARADFFKV